MKIDYMAFWRAVNDWEESAPTELLLSIPALKNHMIEEYGIKFSSMSPTMSVDDVEIVDEKNT